ncbi:MAG: PAS domain S-box protein [Mycobacterium sp.]
MNDLNALLRATADSMLDPQVILEAVRDPGGAVVDFRCVSVNRAACAYLRTTEGELEGLLVLDLLPSLKGSELYRLAIECLRDGGPAALDGVPVLADARRFDVRATAAGVDVIVATWRDVTERFEAAQRLAATELKYRLLAENASDVVLHARDGRVVWVSPSVEQVLGAPPEYWVGQELRVAVKPDEVAAHEDRLKRVAAGGTVEQRVQLVSADGTRHWIDMHSAPFYDLDGRRDGFISSLRLADHDVAAEQEVREAHRQQTLADTRFRRVMDNAAIGMCLVSPEGRFVEVNPALCALFGYGAETLKTKTWQELTAPEFLEADLKNVEDVLEGRRDTYRMLKQYVQADGHRIWGDLSVSCVRATNGRVDTLISQIVDVTGTVEAIANYRLLAENVADVVLRVGTDGTIEWVSPSAEGLLGAPPEYWIGRKARDFVPTEDRGSAADRLARTLAGDVITDRLRVVSVDGVIHWAELRGKAFYDLNGRQDGITAVLRLIDDEVAAQQQADEARQHQARADARYRRAMDTAAIGMCLLAPDGTFVEVNPALCAFFGFDAQTLMRMRWQDLTPPEFLHVGQEDRQAVLEGSRESYRLVTQYIHADGHRIWADVWVNGIRDLDGQVEHLAAQMVDITDEMLTRERLQRSEERNRLLAQRLQRQSDRLAAELKSAADYMASIMPKGLTGRVDIASLYLPSRELSGDCFDYSWIDDDHLLVYLADVSGHGIEPALLSVSVHNMLRSGSLGLETMVAPAAALAELNRLFQMNAQGDHYFTIWFGVYQASTRTLCYASAGAPPAFALDCAADGTVSVTDLATEAAPIGMFADTEFSSRHFAVPPGCRILVYSDGAHEVNLADGRPFSWSEFRDLNIRLAGSTDSSLEALLAELQVLKSTAAFEDDCSLIELVFH